MPRWVSITLIVSTLAACSGGASTLPKATNGSSSAKVHVLVSIRMRVPGAASARTPALKRRFTIAQNTAGAQVAVYAAGNDTGTPLASTVANIEPSTQPGSTCGASDAYGDRTCTFALSAPVGSDDFVITTYDQAPASGATTIPAGAQALGWGTAPAQSIVAGSSATVSATLSSVLASVSLDLTPASLHQLIPSTGTVGVYALDADSDVIVSNGFVDPSGNPISISFALDNSLNGTLYLSTGSISAPSASGVQYIYSPNDGLLAQSGNVTATITASPSSAVASASVALTAIYPSFVSIADSNLNTYNTNHGGIVFDSAGGVYYSTAGNFGGISYYSGTGGSISDNYQASASQPIVGGIAANGTGPFYAVTGSAAQTFSAPPSSTLGPAPNSSAAPIPDGSAMVYDSTNGSLAYVSGTTLAFFPVSSGAPSTYSLGVHATAGVAIDSGGNVWVVDNIYNQLYELPFDAGSVSGPFALQSSGMGFDITTNANGLFISDHGSSPAIIELNSSGNIVNTIPVPGGATPWYMMPDNAQPGIVWFDYILNGQPGIGRMDTNVSPATFVMATDNSAPTSNQVGAIGAASNGLVYLVEDDANTLLQVTR